MIILLIFYINSFSWYPITESDIYGNFNETIKNSSEISSIVRQYGGEEYLIKGFIHLDSDIFKGGEMVLLPKEYKVMRIPYNLKMHKRNIDMRKYNRFTALYREGVLKRKYRELIIKSEDELGISSLKNTSINELRELFPTRIMPGREERERIEALELYTEEEEISSGRTEREIEYPKEYYLSFISIEDDWIERLFPVILHLCPVEGRIEELKNLDE
jgi:hypothetical protein